jgi:hypothetical protein
MKVYLYYRTYWGNENGPGWLGRNILAKSKKELVSVGINSMNLNQLDIKKLAFVDNSIPEYTKYLEPLFDKLIHTSEGIDIDDNKGGWPIFGALGSLMRLMEFMMDNRHNEDDIILLVEDDYLFAPNALKKWIDAIKYYKNHFVTPFDHPDRYIRNDDQFAKKTPIHIVSNHHWRQSESATSVIGGTFSTFNKTFFLRKIPRIYIANRFYPGKYFGRELAGVDRVFNRRSHYFLGVNIYSPIPGIACHLTKFVPSPQHLFRKGVTIPKTQLSPGYDWEKRYNELLKKV